MRRITPATFFSSKALLQRSNDVLGAGLALGFDDAGQIDQRRMASPDFDASVPQSTTATNTSQQDTRNRAA
jgi:hypothetical protein